MSQPKQICVSSVVDVPVLQDVGDEHAEHLSVLCILLC